MHWPLVEQKSAPVQSASETHPDLHAIAPHTYGAHGCVGWLQLPEPSHAPVTVATPATQLALTPHVEPVDAK